MFNVLDLNSFNSSAQRNYLDNSQSVEGKKQQVAAVQKSSMKFFQLGKDIILHIMSFESSKTSREARLVCVQMNQIILSAYNFSISGVVKKWISQMSITTAELSACKGAKVELEAAPVQIFTLRVLNELKHLKSIVEDKQKKYSDRYRLTKFCKNLMAGENLEQVAANLVVAIHAKIAAIQKCPSKFKNELDIAQGNQRKLEEKTWTLTSCVETYTGKLWIDTSSGRILAFQGHDAMPALFEGLKKDDLKNNKLNGSVTVGFDKPDSDPSTLRKKNWRININSSELSESARRVLEFMHEEYQFTNAIVKGNNQNFYWFPKEKQKAATAPFDGGYVQFTPNYDYFRSDT